MLVRLGLGARIRLMSALALVATVLLPAAMAIQPVRADGTGPDAGIALQPAAVTPGHPTSFGYTAYGESGLGIVDSNTHATPTQISAISNAVSLAAGTYHVLALRSDGTVWAWGSNQYGELGVPQSGTCSAFCSATPVQVTGLAGLGFLKNVKAIAAGNDFSVAVLNTGIVVAWGYNGYGQLGRGTTDSNLNDIPVAVHTITNAVSIAASTNHVLALTKDGRVFAWGDDYYGQTGDGTFNTDTSSPVVVATLPTARAIAAGDLFSLAVSTAGNVYSWGYGYYGQLGNGTPPAYNCTTCYNSYAVPTKVVNLTGVTAVSAGYYHSLALKSDGTVWSWGYGGNGQLGNGSTSGTPFNAPVQVIGTGGLGTTLQNATAIAAGYSHSLVLISNGTVDSFGDNGYGDLGNASVCCASATPVQALNPSGTAASGVAAGYYDSLMLTH